MTDQVDIDDDTVRTHATASATKRSARHPSLQWAAASTVGTRRGKNEDRWGERTPVRFAVADGVGSERGGGVAGEAAIEGFLSIRADQGWLHAMQCLDHFVVAQSTAKGVAQAATTLVGLHIDPDSITVVHAGDTRAYLARGDEWTCLTVDHNLGNQRLEQGHDRRHDDGRGSHRALTSYLGDQPLVADIGIATFAQQIGDRILLCTDGVHGQLEADHLAAIVCSQQSDDAVQTLIAESDAAGGRDNATALIVEVQAPC